MVEQYGPSNKFTLTACQEQVIIMITAARRYCDRSCLLFVS